MKINPDTIVTLHFSLKLAEGTLIDTTRNANPATFEYGDGSLLPGFEACLLGLSTGDQCTFHLEPAQAFGAYNPKNQQWFDRALFSSGQMLEIGLVLEFQGPNGYQVPGMLHTLEDERVLVDFNHPLAGRDVEFEVEIMAVELREEAIKWQCKSN